MYVCVHYKDTAATTTRQTAKKETSNTNLTGIERDRTIRGDRKGNTPIYIQLKETH